MSINRLVNKASQNVHQVQGGTLISIILSSQQSKDVHFLVRIAAFRMFAWKNKNGGRLTFYTLTN